MDIDPELEAARKCVHQEHGEAHGGMDQIVRQVDAELESTDWMLRTRKYTGEHGEN